MAQTKEKKSLSLNEWTVLLLGIAFVFGILVRFFPGFQAGFPPNDGGMFLSMIEDLSESHYALPQFTSYNHLQIPYAYPPFGFYLARFLSDMFHIPGLELIRWLPPLVNSLSILAFYLLSSELLKSKPLGALASTFYALTPGAFGWFVMGGGLTRSFGSLFLLLSAFAVYRLFLGERRIHYIAASILFCGLAIFSHPEAIIQTAAVCILLWLFYGQSLVTFRDALIVGAGTLIFTSPWWGTILSYHGLAPFLSALQTGSYGTSLWNALYKMIFDYEGLLPILPLLRVIGISYGLMKKRFFLVSWTILPYLVDPRNAPSVAYYPLTMLVALALAEAIPMLVSRVRNRQPIITLSELYKSNAYNSIIFILFIYLFVESGLYGFRLVNTTLQPAEIQAMTWIKENTPQDGVFLPLTGGQTPEGDPFVEWFPALTGRRSQSTIQGSEWLLGAEFFVRYANLGRLQQCESVACVEAWSVGTKLEYQYIVIAKNDVADALVRSFRDDTAYTSIYSTDDVEVYKLEK
ncbi:MAG: glycosyltransferase family 39 protein [Anaerolineales bacterium]|nr:glycosyltransferase family 39 protein [Anaerolineales bacterium]